jgi:hypothetical protein
VAHVAMAIHLRTGCASDCERLECKVIDLHVVVVPITAQELQGRGLDQQDPDLNHWAIGVAHNPYDADRARQRLLAMNEVQDVIVDPPRS